MFEFCIFNTYFAFRNIIKRIKGKKDNDKRKANKYNKEVEVAGKRVKF